jgi:hypothetical protein
MCILLIKDIFAEHFAKASEVAQPKHDAAHVMQMAQH